MECETDKRLNVLFILTDDHGAWALGCAGNDEIETPNIDKLAARGSRFENFFCTSPVCSPARASLITGRIPSAHGVHDWIAVGDTNEKYEPDGNGELIEYLKDQPGYTDILADAGYHCGISGKWHLGDSHHAQKGFEYWAIHAKGGGPYYNAPMIKNGEIYEEPAYVSDVITDNALKCLDSFKQQSNPFYLSVHYTAPHSPWGCDNHPRELWDHYFNDCPFESVPDGCVPPEWVQYLSIPVNTPEVRREYLSGYYAAVTAMDRGVGRLIDWLELNDLRDNTMIVFTSDNGMNMGHHCVFGKGNATYPLNMFEESVKVPFIVSTPGGASNVKVNELVSQYDFLPTLLDCVGVDNTLEAELPGASFADSIRGGETRGSEHVVVFDEYGPVRMVRTREWKFVRRYSKGPNELYDLKNDPGETANLAGDPERRSTEKDMRDRLEDWFA
ncbi:MAG: sulfatase-like hydrolase/transferase, partial [Victivallales bacterium]|nr:sulfatase-like hydrolase/transferase [Victivallales bacterium]